MKLYTRVKASSEDDVPIFLQIDKLAKWAQLWQLPISYAKCSVVVLSCNKRQTEQFLRIDNHDNIPCVSQVSDPGVTVDTRLKFSTDVSNNICVKAHRKANLILRCFESRNISSLTVAFKTYVRPVLEYCSVIWNLFLIKDIDKLEKVQRRFTKRLPGFKHYTYSQRLNRRLRKLRITTSETGFNFHI